MFQVSSAALIGIGEAVVPCTLINSNQSSMNQKVGAGMSLTVVMTYDLALAPYSLLVFPGKFLPSLGLQQTPPGREMHWHTLIPKRTVHLQCSRLY